jgi:hypothetical protein
MTGYAINPERLVMDIVLLVAVYTFSFGILEFG